MRGCSLLTPCVRTKSLPAPSAAISDLASREKMNELETIKVLLVEDDEDDYVLTRGLFTEMKGRRYQLEWFKSYQLGLAAMIRNQHDVCLVDYRLGAKNGGELLQEGLAKGCQSAIILL